MISMRASLLALIGALAASAATAAPEVTDPLVGTTQATEGTARKGTRNFRAGEDAAAAATTTAPLKSDGLSQKDKLAQCMETWDTGTHITKSKWREICIRQLNER